MNIGVRRWMELLGSMRLAITFLVAIAFASIIGTVILQNQSYSSYQIEFGLFWFKQFAFLGLFDIYHTMWFIGLLGVLLCSTTLCVYRHTPAMIHAMRHWRPAFAPRVLESMPYTAAWLLPHVNHQSAKPFFESCHRALVAQWGAFSAQKNPNERLFVLRWGAGYRWGYILTHLGIVCICLGGLLDSDLMFKWQSWRGLVVPETKDLPIENIPEKSHLTLNNPSYRAQVNVVEGGETSSAFLNTEVGYFLQSLPFKLKLDRFRVEYHPTGQPKAFVSDVTITAADGQIYKQSLEVNKPFRLGSVSVYQSSFGDGGTEIALRAVPLFSAKTAEVPSSVKVFGKYPLADRHVIEVTDFKPINVEANPSAHDTKEGSSAAWKSFFSAVPKERASQVMNMGAAWVYRYRDAQGQAREYHNYLQPIFLDGAWYMVSGTREAQDQPFRYLRFPLTSQGYIEPYFLWRLYFLDEARWTHWTEAFARELEANSRSSKMPFSSQDVKSMANSVLKLFSKGGYEYVAAYLDKQVPKKEQEKVAQLYLRILNQLAFDSYSAFCHDFPEWQAKMPVPKTQEAQGFIRDSLLSIGDSFLYGSPFYLQATGLKPLQSSGFQVTRSPGKIVVYGGCVILVIGTFLLFYWRETRLWCGYTIEEDGTIQLRLSMNSNRLDSLTEQRFKRYCEWVDSFIQQAYPAVSSK